MSEPYVIGYVRVSTEDQTLALQKQALVRWGVDPNKIIEETASGKTMNRKGLARVLKALRKGDTLVVWKLDRLGRTLKGVLEVLEHIEKEGVHFVSVTESFDTSKPMGKAFLQFALVMAELERNLISERTKAGIAAAKAAGQRFGRAHSIKDSPKRLARLRALDRAGKLRDENGELLMSAAALAEVLNRADPNAAPITSPETVRRWKREGFEGLADLDGDEPLDLDDE